VSPRGGQGPTAWHRGQRAAAQRRALLHGATSGARGQQRSHAGCALLQGATSARVQQHGGVRFCRAPRQSERSRAAVRASASAEQPWRREPKSTAACAFLPGAASARAKQRGGVRFHRARTSPTRGRNSTAACMRFCVAPRQQPEHNSTAACASAERRGSQGTAGAPFLPLHFF
jgi:hypothetical protein